VPPEIGGDAVGLARRYRSNKQPKDLELQKMLSQEPKEVEKRQYFRFEREIERLLLCDIICNVILPILDEDSINEELEADAQIRKSKQYDSTR